MALTTNELLRFLIQFALLLIVARLLGEALRRFNQPQVIGELLAGILLGPSLLGAAFPAIFHSLFPAAGPQNLLMQLVSEIGVILLLLVSGMETDIDLVRRKVKPALTVAILGMLVPFAAGYGLAAFLPAAFVGHDGERAAFQLFVATAMSISAIPVIVKIMIDMDLMRRDIGQITLAAGIVNDTVGWFLLAFVAGIATSHGSSLSGLGLSIFGTLAYAVFAFTVGYRVIRVMITWVDDHFGGESPLVTAVVAIGVLGAAVTQALHVEAFLGAFLIGVQIGRVPRVTRAIRSHLEAMTLAVFAPIFFASAGLKVNLTVLTGTSVLVLIFVIAVASVSKFIGAYAGARIAGLKHWMAVGLGSGMNARGAVEIIVATIGLQMGILTVEMYSIIVVMAVATSMMAPPLLRWSLRRVTPDAQEENRLRRELIEEKSFLYSLRRMLVPVRDGRNALHAAEIVNHLAGERSVEATLLHVRQAADNATEPGVNPGERVVEVAKATAKPNGTNIEWKQRVLEPVQSVADAILSESARGYDLLVVGAGRGRAGSTLFGALADTLVLRAPCSVFVLFDPGTSAERTEIGNILVPTGGTAADLRAAEFAVELAKGVGAEVTALHVIEAHPLTGAFSGDAWDLSVMQTAQEHGVHAVAEIAKLGDGWGVPVRQKVTVRAGLSVSDEVVRYAQVSRQNLIVLRAERRPSGGGLYSGRTVDRVVRTAKCPVAVLFPKP